VKIQKLSTNIGRAYIDSFQISKGNKEISQVLRLHEPSGLLQIEMPGNMSTVEGQFEDVPHDMRLILTRPVTFMISDSG
jgi:hypothetical protein